MIDRTPRMTAAEYRAAVGMQAAVTPRTQHDHCKAVRTQGADGSMMDSSGEAKRSRELEAMRLAGEIRWWLGQVKLPVGISEKGRRTYYVADFMICWPDGSCTFEDYKGYVDSNRQKRDALRAMGLDVRTV